VWFGLFELRKGRSGIGAGNHMNVLAAESNLDDLAHGGAVVDEINGWHTVFLGFLQGRNHHGFAHGASLSAVSRELSSTSRMASSINRLPSAAPCAAARWCRKQICRRLCFR